MEQAEQGMKIIDIERVRGDVRRICTEDFVEKWKKIAPIEFDYDFEQWEELFTLNYLRAYFRMFSEPKDTFVNKKILKEKIELFDEIIRTEVVLNGTNICKVKDIMCKFDRLRKMPLIDRPAFDEEPKVSYAALAEQVMTFFMRTNQHILKTEKNSEIQVNEQLIVPFIILAIVYKEFRLDKEGEWHEIGEGIKRHFYSTKRIEGYRMSSAVNYILKCIAELLYYNRNLVDKLAQNGFEVSADVGNCLCEDTGFYTTDLMESMEKDFIDNMDDAPEWSQGDDAWLRAISDVEIHMTLQRLSENTPDMSVGKKDDPERNYMGLLVNGFKRTRDGKELSDDRKPLYNRLLQYFKKDKDSVYDLFKRNSTTEEWEEILEVLPTDEALECALVKMFKAICLVEFGLEYGGTLEQPLFDLSVATMFAYFAEDVEDEMKDVAHMNSSFFYIMCDLLPEIQVALQNPSASEVEKVFGKYMGCDGKINAEDLTAMYFAPF